MEMTRWDWFLFALAAFVAVRALLRILIARRNELQAEVDREREKAARLERARAENAAAAAALLDAADEDASPAATRSAA